MAELNSVLLEGTLVRNPETKMVGEKTVVSFPIAVHRFYRSKTNASVSETSFFNIQAWGGIAEAADRFLTLGRTIRVLGRLKQDSWQDKRNNSYREKVYVVANHMEFRPKVRDKDGNVVLGTPITLDNDLDGISAGSSAIMNRIAESVRLFRSSKASDEKDKAEEPLQEGTAVTDAVGETIFADKEEKAEAAVAAAGDDWESEDFDLTSAEADQIASEIRENEQIPAGELSGDPGKESEEETGEDNL